MKVFTFVARSALEAVEQIRAQLGPEALVLHVRQLPAPGWSRFWHAPRIEVQACLPSQAGPPQGDDPLAALARGLPPRDEAPPSPGEFPPDTALLPAGAPPSASPGVWKCRPVLEKMGLLPVIVQQVLETIQGLHGTTPPATLAEELEWARQAFDYLWKPAPESSAGSVSNNPHGPQIFRPLWKKSSPSKTNSVPFHVMIGPAGSGKTVALCKWLTQTVLLQGQPARVWRLDGITANTAESLSVYCEILNLPVERHCSPAATGEEESLTRWIDLPGIDWQDPAQLEALGKMLEDWPNSQIHLVLNAAYDNAALMAQARAFSQLPIADLILSHLDEVSHWAKVWNLALGTNYTVRFLSSGQNIPGGFVEATPEQIFHRHFPL